MSQLSLLLQSKLQNLKPEKNQSAQWISEVKDHPDWKEIKAKDRSEQIDNLVVLAYLFSTNTGGSSRVCYSRAASLCFTLLSTAYRLSGYPESDEISRYPSGIVCTCGNVLAIQASSWGLVKHCSSCKTPHSTRFYVPMFQDAIARSGCATREWAEWAQVQAILLRNKRNLRVQTAIESLDSEK